MRNWTILFTSRCWLVAFVVFVAGCIVSRTTPRIDAGAIRQIAVYDCRTLSGVSTERFVKTIETTDELEGIVELFGRYQEGWAPLRGTEPVGMLRIDYFDTNSPDPAQGPTAQFRLTRSGVVTHIGGKPYRHDISPADRKAICQLTGLEETFFSESHGDE